MNQENFPRFLGRTDTTVDQQRINYIAMIENSPNPYVNE